MTENKHKQTEAVNKSEIGAKNERKKPKEPASGKQTGKEKQTLGNDYWNRVAEDVASGYKNKQDENSILNTDQEPGDNERGDKASE